MNKENKTFLVLGASTNEQRYSNIAVKRLSSSGFNVIAVGRNGGEINGITIHKEIPEFTKPHTILMYLSQENQSSYTQAIIDMKPERIIFNPGSENRDFAAKLKEAGIQVVEACALVMHSIKKL